MAPLERDIEQALVAMIKRRGGLCLKWVCPGWAGVPDRIILLPGGRIFFVELKRKGGRLSRMQLWWQEKLTNLGFPFVVIWNEEDLQHFKEVVLRKKT